MRVNKAICFSEVSNDTCSSSSSSRSRGRVTDKDADEKPDKAFVRARNAFRQLALQEGSLGEREGVTEGLSAMRGISPEWSMRQQHREEAGLLDVCPF